MEAFKCFGRDDPIRLGAQMDRSKSSPVGERQVNGPRWSQRRRVVALTGYRQFSTEEVTPGLVELLLRPRRTKPCRFHFQGDEELFPDGGFPFLPCNLGGHQSGRHITEVGVKKLAAGWMGWFFRQSGDGDIASEFGYGVTILHPPVGWIGRESAAVGQQLLDRDRAVIGMDFGCEPRQDLGDRRVPFEFLLIDQMPDQGSGHCFGARSDVHQVVDGDGFPGFEPPDADRGDSKWFSLPVPRSKQSWQASLLQGLGQDLRNLGIGDLSIAPRFVSWAGRIRRGSFRFSRAILGGSDRNREGRERDEHECRESGYRGNSTWNGQPIAFCLVGCQRRAA